MDIFSIVPKTATVFGDGASSLAGKKLKELGCKKVMAVFDEGVEALGLVDGVLSSIKTEGIAVVCYKKVIPDPTDASVNAAGKFAVSENVDGIIALGGGPPMDTAKGARVLTKNPGPINRYFGLQHMERGVPLILVPTTFGAGSEISISAVLTDTVTGKGKLGVRGNLAFPEYALIDPSLSKGMPKRLVAINCMDVFAHCIECLRCLGFFKSRGLISPPFSLHSSRANARLYPNLY